MSEQKYGWRMPLAGYCPSETCSITHPATNLADTQLERIMHGYPNLDSVRPMTSSEADPEANHLVLTFGGRPAVSSH